MTDSPTHGGAHAAGPADQDPTTRERLSWMAGNSRRLIIGLVALAIAGVVVVFSFSLFNSSSANPGNMASTGIMEIENSDEGQAILTAEGLLPGESGEGTVTIENVGDADGDFSLTMSNVVDEPADPALSGVLTLTVNDGSTDVYDGPLADLGTVDLGTWAAGDTRTYTFTVTFDVGSGNEYQDASTTLDLTWNATQSS